MEAILNRPALVLFSGGQDSTTCLAWALSRFERVATVGFSYGQRHSVEMEARQTVLSRLKQEFPEWSARIWFDHVIQLDLVGELGRDKFDHAVASTSEPGFASGKRYIPGRNLLFVSMAGVIAYRTGIADLVFGVSETEYSGYPDCTGESVAAMERAVSSSLGRPTNVQAPLMHLDKRGVWALAEQLGGPRLLSIMVEDTHTCYAGARSPIHAWGRGCGSCNACLLRAKGYREYRPEPEADG